MFFTHSHHPFSFSVLIMVTKFPCICSVKCYIRKVQVFQSISYSAYLSFRRIIQLRTTMEYQQYAPISLSLLHNSVYSAVIFQSERSFPFPCTLPCWLCPCPRESSDLYLRYQFTTDLLSVLIWRIYHPRVFRYLLLIHCIFHDFIRTIQPYFTQF